jgi:hypothetical protein
MLVEPPCGMPHQLGRGGQVPIGVADTDMPEKCRKHGQLPLNIFSSSIPAEQRHDGAAMAKIMYAWAVTLSLLSKADLQRQLPEDAMHVLMQQASSLLGNEE